MENRIEIYKKSCDILYQAYFNNTLEHTNCYACAVGNLVAGNNEIKYKSGFSLEKVWDCDRDTSWFDIIGTNTGHSKELIKSSLFSKDCKRQIESTGYTPEEIIDIEYTFESAEEGNNDEDWMFNGLCDVLDLLKLIHGIEELENTKQKERFKEHYLQLTEN